MKKETLFGVLSRAPWWVSVLIAGALFVVLRQFIGAPPAAAAAFPFLCLAVYAAWRQTRTPSAGAAEKLLEELRAASWEEFSERLCETFRRDGYEVARGGAADLVLKKNGRVTLAGCRRWRVAQTGLGPLKELVQARETREADECLCVTAGRFTPQAEAFAARYRVRLIAGDELARLALRVPARAKRPARA